MKHHDQILLAVPPFLLSASADNHFIDGNGITGPDLGHSELVFKCFCNKMLSAPEARITYAALPGISLFNVLHSTRLVCVLSFFSHYYSTVNLIVNTKIIMTFPESPRPYLPHPAGILLSQGTAVWHFPHPRRGAYSFFTCISHSWHGLCSFPSSETAQTGQRSMHFPHRIQ